jgi:hypothetical protein
VGINYGRTLHILICILGYNRSLSTLGMDKISLPDNVLIAHILGRIRNITIGMDYSDTMLDRI